MQACACVCTRKRVRALVYVYACMHARAYVRASVFVCMCACVSACVRARARKNAIITSCGSARNAPRCRRIVVLDGEEEAAAGADGEFVTADSIRALKTSSTCAFVVFISARALGVCLCAECVCVCVFVCVCVHACIHEYERMNVGMRACTHEDDTCARMRMAKDASAARDCSSAACSLMRTSWRTAAGT